MSNYDKNTLEYWQQAYDDMLDDFYPDGVFGIPASKVLRECDPIAYREGFYHYLDGAGIDSDTLEGDLNE